MQEELVKFRQISYAKMQCIEDKLEQLDIAMPTSTRGKWDKREQHMKILRSNTAIIEKKLRKGEALSEI